MEGESKPRTGDWHWCSTCGRGVEGVLGKPCPQCVHRDEGDRTGTLQTPKQAEAEHLRLAAAIKLARQDKVVKGIKSVSEMHDEFKKEIKDTMLVEMREQIKKELREEMRAEAKKAEEARVDVQEKVEQELADEGKEVKEKKEVEKPKVTSSTKKSLKASGSPKS